MTKLRSWITVPWFIVDALSIIDVSACKAFQDGFGNRLMSRALKPLSPL
jgi:hypothetical protein